MKKKKFLGITLIVLLLTTIQSSVMALPPEVLALSKQAVMSVLCMFVVQSLTIVKQRLSVEIDNNALIPTYVMLAISVLGLANEMFNSLFGLGVHISASWSMWIRFSITVITGFLNLASKLIWSTDDTVSKI